MKDSNDEKILSRAISGDNAAFGELYEKYVARIYNYVYYRTGSIYDAEDLTERVFMRAMNHIGSYKDYGLPFSAWLYRIAHNLVANWHRDNSRRKEVSLDERSFVHHQSEHPESQLLILEEKEALMTIIRRLPPDRQQVLILKFVEHLTNYEIGQVMGRTEGAIKSLYHRTLINLREEIRNAYSDEGIILREAIFGEVVEDII